MAALFNTLFPRGFRLINGQVLNILFGGPYLGRSYEDAITAHAGGTKASAYQLQASWNRISVVGTAADSVKLPPLQEPGAEVVIINDTVTSAQIFGANNDTVDGVATATGVAQAGGKRVVYRCMSVSAAGVRAWYSMAGAATS